MNNKEKDMVLEISKSIQKKIEEIQSLLEQLQHYNSMFNMFDNDRPF